MFVLLPWCIEVTHFSQKKFYLVNVVMLKVKRRKPRYFSEQDMKRKNMKQKKITLNQKQKSSNMLFCFQ